MPRISIGDCHIYYERHGEGFPVLFVSGLSGYGAFWRDQIPTFSKSFEVIVHDQRGIGQSDHARGTLTVERLAADVIALMDALGLEKAHMVGHSTGGAIAQVLALEHPRRLASAVMVATWTRSDAYLRRLFNLRREILCRLGPAAYVQANTLFLYPSFYIARNNEKLRQFEAQNLTTFSEPEIITSRIDAILAFDRAAELSRVRTPTLIIAVEDDTVIPAYFSEELARLIPGAEVKFFPQGGHCVPHVKPREFNQAVLPFLTAHTPG